MSGIHLDWHGDEATEHVRGKAVVFLASATAAMATRARELIAIQGPPRSSPGDPPHMDTGRLHASIASEVNFSEMRATVGTDVEYGLYLELGTSKMAARPWLRRAMAETAEKIGSWRDEGDLPAIPAQSGGVVGFVKRAASRVAKFFGLGKGK